MLVYEFQRFLQMFAEPMTRSTPHIYVSALSLVPSSSLIKVYYGRYKTLSVSSEMMKWPQMRAVFHGHQQQIHSASYSPDGRHIVSGSSDNTIRIWEAVTGNLVVPPIKGHTDWIRSVAYSPDGKHIISGSHDHTIRIWDALTGNPVVDPIHGHIYGVASLVFSPDGKRFISGSHDTTIKIWEAVTGKLVAGPIQGHTVSTRERRDKYTH